MLRPRGHNAPTYYPHDAAGVKKKSLKITYTGKTPVTLDLEWSPPGPPTSVTIPDANGAKVTVPHDAYNLIVTDPTGGAPYRDVPVGD